MASLSTLIAQLDTELSTSTIPDYAGAWNGLQLQNRSGQVERIIAAVDACLPVVTAAVAAGGPALLIVHHGMFWQGVQPVAGPVFTKLDHAIGGDLAIYSSHIPLDVHKKWGNNAQLAAALGLRKTVPFFDWKGIKLGLSAGAVLSRDALVQRVSDATGTTVHLCPGGPEKVKRIGIITGGAGSEIAAIAATGVDTFITGEGPHWSYTLAEELGVNVLYAGHYATETFGVKAISAWLAAKHQLPWAYIDHATGL